MRLDGVDPGVAVRERLLVRQPRNVVELQVVVRVDQAGQDKVIVEIDSKRAGGRASHPAADKGQRFRGHAVVMHHARTGQHGARASGHGRSVERRESVHTHRRQIASRSTSSPCRQATAAGELRTAVRPPAEYTLPSGGWKKQGRTVPSDSTTVDTHGALQSFG